MLHGTLTQICRYRENVHYAYVGEQLVSMIRITEFTCGLKMNQNSNYKIALLFFLNVNVM